MSKTIAGSYDIKEEKLKNWNNFIFNFKGECESCKKKNQSYFTRCKSKKCIKCLEKKLFKNKKPIKIKSQSLFVINKNAAKLKKEKIYTCSEPCSICGERNKTYYTSQNATRCTSCNSKKQYEYVKKCPQRKIANIARSRVATMVKNLTGQTKKYKLGTFENIFGCKEEKLIRHLESKFTPKMSWENYGAYWHVDHIIPISSFDLTDPEQCKKANHWTNLQPLEASKNIAKSNTITKPQMSLMLNI